MMGGFLASRAVLSMATLAFGLNALWNINPKRWFQNKWWVLGALWVLIFIFSYYWSTDKDFWYHHSELKMPFLLFPLVFYFLPPFSPKQLLIFTIATGCMLIAGACYSSSFLIGHMDYYMEQYRVAHVLPTPAEGDYIRFSVCIALYIIWCFSFWSRLNYSLKWLIGIFISILVIYLHILASKSGLITLYVFLIFWAVYIAVSKKKLLPGIGIVVLMALGLLLAFKYIPTFHQRAGYISYSYIVYTEGDQSGTYGDIGRLMSYDVAEKQIKANPVRGVGAGDMLHAMIKGYETDYPKVAIENRLLPHNQFLIIALGWQVVVALRVRRFSRQQPELAPAT